MANEEWQAGELREKVCSEQTRAERYKAALEEIAAVPGKHRGSVEAVKVMYIMAQKALGRI